MEDTTKLLTELRAMITELRATSSSGEKQEILKRHPTLQTLLLYTYDTYRNYYMTGGTVKKYMEKGGLFPAKVSLSLYELLDKLSERQVTGDSALNLVAAFLTCYKDYHEEILLVLDRDLKCRIGVKQINNAFPGLIPTFSVALASNYKDYADKVDFDKDEYFASRKLDGARLILVYYPDGTIKTYSRNGKEYLTLDKIKEEIRTHYPDLKGMVLDGEICVMDKDGNESFADVMKLIQRKDYTIEHPVYNVFDILSIGDFFAGSSYYNFSVRQQCLTGHFPLLKASPYIKRLPQTRIHSIQALDAMMAEAKANGWEGLILRKNALYQGKRSSDLLKIKEFFDAEYVVQSIVTGPFNYVSEGREASEEMVCSVKILHKGNEVGVGSGFTIDQRKYYYAHPEDLVGKTIKVKYFEESVDTKTGMKSLRFPTVLHIYDGKRFD